MPTSSLTSLTLSLIFGAAQLVVGGVVAWRLWARSTWRRPNMFALLLIALWFVASGMTELFVSGMETAHDLRGVPSAASFTLWRGRADAALTVVSVILVVMFLVALAVHYLRRLERAQ